VADVSALGLGTISVGLTQSNFSTHRFSRWMDSICA
jgi:hypothetical protein